VVYDEGHTNLAIEKVKLGDGATYTFREALTRSEMERKMAHQNLGLVLPADLDQTLISRGTPTLSGYVFWADRMGVAALESKYNQAFTEIVGQPVRVEIARNIVIPQSDAVGMQTTVSSQLVYFVFWTGMSLIPYLMLEEKKAKTMDALLTSPASVGQVVLGKALAGLFYILVVGGLAVALNWAYIVNWGLALTAFLGYALFAGGLALALGSLVKSSRQLGIWSVVLILLAVIPPLFYMEQNLKPGIRTVLTWFPTSALASLFRFACSAGITPAQLLPNLGVVVLSIGLAFSLVIWKVRRSDR
jgi:ABC-2 type transport system permease protein